MRGFSIYIYIYMYIYIYICIYIYIYIYIYVYIFQAVRRAVNEMFETPDTVFNNLELFETPDTVFNNLELLVNPSSTAKKCPASTDCRSVLLYIGGRGLVSQIIELVMFGRCAFIIALWNIALDGYLDTRRNI